MGALTGEIGRIDTDGHSLRCLVAGDRFMLLEVAIETLPMFVSILVHYDSIILSPQRLFDVVRSLWLETAGEKDIVIPSRLIEIPVHYLDPWTEECVED